MLTIPSLSNETARCHSPALAHAPIAALKMMRSGGTPSVCILRRSCKALVHSPALSQAEMAAEYVIVFGGIPACLIKAMSRRAVRHSPAREHDATAAEKVIVSGGICSDGGGVCGWCEHGES